MLGAAVVFVVVFVTIIAMHRWRARSPQQTGDVQRRAVPVFVAWLVLGLVVAALGAVEGRPPIAVVGAVVAALNAILVWSVLRRAA
jgi:hypothetical protein